MRLTSASLFLGLTLGACAQLPAAIPDSELVATYARAEQKLLAEGHMRTAPAPNDARFSIDDLVENFVRIALYDEFSVSGENFVPEQTRASLRRWATPVRVEIVIGNSVSDGQIEEDILNVEAYTAHLASLTGVDMRLARDEEEFANFTVLFLNRAEQRRFGRDMAINVPEMPRPILNAFRDSPPETFCVAYTFGAQGSNTYSAALILVKAEQRGLMRLSCIHEEMAQAMGLSNDSPAARPSIFNDDEEFALLTTHDEILLRMLYDPRLKPGMAEAEARPLLPAIARDAVRAARATRQLIN